MCTDIENFINRNPSTAKEIVKGSVYEKYNEFVLLPGHRAILLGLPKKIEQIESEKREKKQKKQRNTTTSSSLDENKQNRTADNPEKKLQSKLIEKVKNYWVKRGFDLEVLTTSNISDFQFIGGEYKCSVLCPFCIRKVPCTFKKYWEVSNLNSHLQTHVETVETTEIVEADETIKAIETIQNIENDTIKVVELSGQQKTDLLSILEIQ